MDLETRLREGPLRVRSIWSAEPPERLARKILRRRRVLFSLDVAMVGACVALISQAGFRHRAWLPSSAGMSVAQATTFADGSRAELSSRDAELRVEQDGADRVVSRLKGGARFQVVPNPRRTFEVQAGEVRVRVLGTTFSVQELPSGQTQVLVEHGRVEVAWLGGATLLESGQGGAFPPAPSAEKEAEPQSAEKEGEAPADPQAIASPRSTSSGQPRRSWRDYAQSGDYAKAYDELHSRTRDGVRDDAADLMLAADVARLSAHPEQAVQPLRALCDRHPTDRRAPVAAFTLGRVLLDDLGRPAEAAAAFQKARALWPEGPLVEDSLAREADAWDRAGRGDRARTAAGQYLARYAQGRHAAAMRKLLAR